MSIPSSSIAVQSAHKKFMAEKITNQKQTAKSKLRPHHSGTTKVFTVLLYLSHTTKQEQVYVQQLAQATSQLEDIHLMLLGAPTKTGRPASSFALEDFAHILPAADVVLFFKSAVQKSLQPIMQSFKAGIVPILPVQPKLQGIVTPYNPLQESGNCFQYTKEDIWNIFATIIQARENFKFPYDWQNIVRACLQS